MKSLDVRRLLGEKRLVLELAAHGLLIVNNLQGVMARRF